MATGLDEVRDQNHSCRIVQALIVMKKNIFLFLFFFVALAEIFIQVFDWQEFNVVVKPLIVISLAAFYFQNSPSKNQVFALALFFC